jgi:hypothetical protein
MTCSLACRLASALAMAFVMSGTATRAIDLDVTTFEIESALEVARGAPPARAAFHKPYIFAGDSPIVEKIEVVTERRRIVLVAEDHIAQGDHMFARGVRPTAEALRPHRRRVSVVATVRFANRNLIMAPGVDVVLRSSSADVPRLDLQTRPIYLLGSGAGNEPATVIGAVADAIYDAAPLAEASRLAIVRIEGKEVGGVTIDFSRLD